MDYVYSVKCQLDKMDNKDEVTATLEKTVSYLKENGCNEDEIRELFATEKVFEEQGNDVMIANHHQYLQIVKKILKGNK